MEPSPPQSDPMLDATLREMADITLPPDVSMMPATVGWAVVAVAISLALAFAVWRWLRHRAQNRYRRDALAELAELEAEIGQPDGRQRALASLPELLKRTALAVWPREAVAALNGQEWVDFLKMHAGRAKMDDKAYLFFSETVYRLPIAASDDAAARRTIAAARQWIEGHNVHP